jgi:hypothetical protein
MLSRPLSPLFVSISAVRITRQRRVFVKMTQNCDQHEHANSGVPWAASTDCLTRESAVIVPASSKAAGYEF